jgi:starch-binding outer membrane protein, SusD/RagB family
MRASYTRNRTTRSRALQFLGVLVAFLTLSGCDRLLDVTIPGEVDASDLDNPALARSLVVSAIGEFECAYNAYLNGVSILSEEHWVSSGWRNYNIWGARLDDLRRWGGVCLNNLGDGDALGFWTALARARFQTDDVFNRIQEFQAEELPIDKTASLAMLAAYAGYSYTLLGEGFCEMAIDGGPLMNPEEVLTAAEARFTTAAELAQQAGETDIYLMAMTGRARVRLNLGQTAGAAADARLIPEGFVLNATHSTSTPRRQNRIYLNTHRNEYLTVAPDYRDLEIDGVADPRIPVEDTGGPGEDGSTPLWLQMKYDSPITPIPIASWEEAQLIIAEAELGQVAVDRINALRDQHDLPHYEPQNVADDGEILAQVLEERRRQLFLEGGHRYNDMLRHDIPFPSGSNHKGEPYGPITCMPLPEQERIANPNIDS